jgi:hypothetical protein
MSATAAHEREPVAPTAPRGARGGLGSWPFLALGVALVALEWARHGWPYPASDDPYIYLGYVKRVLTSPHELFSYNPGEHSAGTTGLLYYYLLIPIAAAARGLLFFLPLERVLLLALWATNVALFVLAGATYLRAADALGARPARASTPADAALFLLFCAHPKFLWGAFSGLENPLAALLALLVVERLLRRAPAWQASLAAAGLGATRPETLVVLWVVPLLAGRASPPGVAGGAARRLAGAFGAWCGALGLLALPCRLLTERWYPSALGTRVSLAPLAGPGALAASVSGALGRASYWSSEWLLLAASSLALATFLVRRGRAVLAGTFGLLLAFYVVRALLGLFDFSVEDRYVSWVWPLHALGFVAAMRGLAPLAQRATDAPSTTRRTTLAVACLALASVPLGDFLRRFERHVDLMDRVVVQPSLWMRAHLPATSRICMEPAGAIRVFTDFYLVDAKGLTTNHRHGFRGDYLSFLALNRVDYVFDRDDPGAQLAQTGLGRELLTWARGVRPWGDIRLWEVGPPRHAVIDRITADGAADARAAAAFDNVAGPDAPGVPFDSPSAFLDVDLARPAPVDAVRLVVRATPPLDSARAWRVEAQCAGEAAIRSVALAPEPEDAPPTALVTLGARLERPGTLLSLRLRADGSSTVEIVELSLRWRATTLRWLDARTGAAALSGGLSPRGRRPSTPRAPRP